MRVKKKIKKIISIFLVCVMAVSNIQFLYAENTDSETTKIESIDVEKNENEDLATLSQIELEEEKKELKEEPEEEKEREASSSEIDEIEKEEKEEEATRSEIEKEQEEEKQEEKEEQEEQEEQEEKATSSQIEEKKTPLKKEEDIIIIEATASNISEIKIEEQVVFAAPQEYTLSPSWYDETAAGKAKGEITKIKISKSPDVAPTDSDASWNISGSNGLIAYIKGTDITIYAPNEGTIFMAEDSSYLFSGNNTGMFNKLAAIQNLNLLDTSKVKNMSSMFEAAQNLTSIDLSNFNTSNVEDMSKMFFFCRGLYQLDVSGFDTKEVKSFNDMFFSCQRVSAIDVTKFNTDNCENMAGMFYGCDSLSKVDVSKFNTAKVTDMSSMFNSCYSLTTIDLSNFDTSNVTDLSHMFYMFNKNMSNLKKLDLSSFDTKNVTSMAQIFYNCNALETILASSKFVTTGLTQEKSDLFMFSGCQSIKGGNGTPYNDNKVDKTYAKIDESGSPGYFTAKEAPPVPVEGKVTFIFDLQGHGNNYNVTINVGERLKKPTNPIASGYKFVYWFEGMNESLEYDFSKVIEKDSEKLRTLKAKWIQDSGSGGSPSGGSTGGSSRSATLPNNMRQNLNVTQQGTQAVNKSSFGTMAAMNKAPITNLLATTVGNVAVFTTQNGEKLQGMQKVTVGGQDSMYYFNDDSTLYCGWMKDENNNYHYFNTDGKMVVDKTVRMNNQDYRINAQGELEQASLDSLNKQAIFNQCMVQLYTGEAKKNDATDTWSVEVMNPITGQKEPAKGMVKLVQDDGVNTYYFDNSGNLLTGWQFVDQKLLFFSPENGKLIDVN